MIATVAALALVTVAAAPSSILLVTEPKTGLAFPASSGDMSLMGIGLRTKTLLKFKVFALGFYVADSALSGTLAAHKGATGSSAFYRDLVTGDFEKQFVLKLARDLSAEQIEQSFRSHMPAANPKLLDQFVSYFGQTRAGQECIFHWVPGGRLEVTVAGVVQRPIADKAFADELFAIWLRDRPTEDPIRKQLVSRAAGLIAAACPPRSRSAQKQTP
jgi:Chalcone isomerase-like